MSGQLTAESIRAAVDSLVYARSQTSVNYSGIVHPFAVKDFMQDTACRCGKTATRRPRSGWRLCEGCYFRYKVMKAAGRLDEFLKSQGREV